MSFAREIPQAIKEQCRVQVQNFLHEISGIEFVMLCSSDGFELATASKKNLDNHGKIAAVSSSIMALISAFITEMHLDECQTIMLDTANGKALLTTITHQQFPSVLVVLTQKQVLLGEMFYELKNTCEHFLSFRSVAA